MLRTATLLDMFLATKARLPSGVMATAATSSSIGTSPRWVTLAPWMDSTETLLDARLAISARSPLREIARPDGWPPTVSVSISLGGLAARSTTNSLLSGATLHLPPASWVITELASNPSLPSGVICKLVGGPTTELDSGSDARMRGLAGWLTSTTTSASLPPDPIIWPSGPNAIFSSIPTRMSVVAAKPLPIGNSESARSVRFSACLNIGGGSFP